MSSPDETQRTTGGLDGNAVGKVKEVLGQAGDSEQSETQIEHDRAATEHRADARAANERVAADAHEAERRANEQDPIKAAARVKQERLQD